MANDPKSTANLVDREKDSMVDAKAPQHGNPAENLSPHESVINVRVGSEASVSAGTDPVLPPEASVVSAQTKVHNKDLRERDKKEREKRGPDGGVFDVSMSFPGLMAVEVDGELVTKSGSFTGRFAKSIVLRPLTEAELEEHLPHAEPANRGLSEAGTRSNPRSTPQTERTQPLGAGVTTSRPRP